MLRNYSAWWCHHWEQHIDMKSVAQVDWQMDPCLQLERWLKSEDDFVQHHLGMHTLVTQSFLLLTSFASDWRSVSSIDLGFTNIFRRISKFANEECEKQADSSFFYPTFPYPATSAIQPLLSNLIQPQQPQSLKIWEPKCSDTWNTMYYVKYKYFLYFLSILEFSIRDILPSLNVFCVGILERG